MAGAARRFVTYERVSTKRQGASRLGLDAQRKAIDDLVASRGAEVITRFTEVESGKKANRPELVKALHLATVTGATLLIAKPCSSRSSLTGPSSEKSPSSLISFLLARASNPS